VAGWFYRLRAALVEQGVPRRDVRPGTRLEQLLPRRRRRQAWNEVEHRLGQTLPVFAERPLPGCTIVSLSVSLVLLCLFGAPLLALLDPWAALGDVARLGLVSPLPMLVLALGTVLTVSLLRRRLLCDFNARHATAGQVARCLAEAAQSGEEVPWTSEEVWLAVRRLVAGVRGGRPREVTWQTALLGPGGPEA
jgi:hypothetical protein